MILIVYLGHGIFHPAAVSFFSKSVQNWERSEAPKLRGSIRKKVAHPSIVVRVVRRARRTLAIGSRSERHDNSYIAPEKKQQKTSKPSDLQKTKKKH